MYQAFPLAPREKRSGEDLGRLTGLQTRFPEGYHRRGWRQYALQVVGLKERLFEPVLSVVPFLKGTVSMASPSRNCRRYSTGIRRLFTRDLGLRPRGKDAGRYPWHICDFLRFVLSKNPSDISRMEKISRGENKVS